MRKLGLGIASVTVVVISFGVLTARGVTSKPLVAVQVDEFSVFPGTQGAPRGKVRFVVTNIGTVKHEFVVLKAPAGRHPNPHDITADHEHDGPNIRLHHLQQHARHRAHHPKPQPQCMALGVGGQQRENSRPEEPC